MSQTRPVDACFVTIATTIDPVQGWTLKGGAQCRWYHSLGGLL